MTLAGCAPVAPRRGATGIGNRAVHLRSREAPRSTGAGGYNHKSLLFLMNTRLYCSVILRERPGLTREVPRFPEPET